MYAIFYYKSSEHKIEGGCSLKALSDVTPKPVPLTFSLHSINACDNQFSYPNQLSIIFIESGLGSAKINDTHFDFVGPAIICLNEVECLTINKSKHLSGNVLSFAPSVIREYFNFKNLRNLDHSFTPNDIGLVIYLSIFFQRFPNYFGYLPTSEPLMKQFNKLLADLLSYNSSLNSISNIFIEILSPIKRLVQSNLLLENVIITETAFEVKDVLMYLHKNCKQKITIPKLSKQFHVNRTTLSDRFFEATGETIITYLNKYRINLAAITLRESSCSISDIAEEVGFNDTSYFAKLFKKYMLYTPSGYRQHYVSLCQVHKADASD